MCVNVLSLLLRELYSRSCLEYSGSSGECLKKGIKKLPGRDAREQESDKLLRNDSNILYRRPGIILSNY